jgi:ComF family protein
VDTTPHYSLEGCWFCRAAVTASSAPLCVACLTQLPWLGTSQCHCCAVPLPVAAVCRECSERPPPFIRSYIPLSYRPPVGRLIEPLKRQCHSPAATLLARLMAATLSANHREPSGLLLVGLPLHPRRALRRGFSQAALLAELVGTQLGIAAPTTARLERHRYQPPQRGQSRHQRLANLRDSFTAIGVAGRHIGLVDDVVTTTATARAAGAALLAAGAVSVELVAAARTPKGPSNH